MPNHNLNQSGLDAWLEKAESVNEIKRISAPMDPHLELATIAYLRGLKRSPALLFENIIGHPGHRLLINIIGSSVPRLCLTIGEDPLTTKKLGTQLFPSPSAVGRPQVREIARPAFLRSRDH